MGTNIGNGTESDENFKLCEVHEVAKEGHHK
jgi:hypothetical protein